MPLRAALEHALTICGAAVGLLLCICPAALSTRCGRPHVPVEPGCSHCLCCMSRELRQVQVQSAFSQGSGHQPKGKVLRCCGSALTATGSTSELLLPVLPLLSFLTSRAVSSTSTGSEGFSASTCRRQAGCMGRLSALAGMCHSKLSPACTLTSSFTRLSWSDPPPEAFVFCISARASCTACCCCCGLSICERPDSCWAMVVFDFAASCSQCVGELSTHWETDHCHCWVLQLRPGFRDP